MSASSLAPSPQDSGSIPSVTQHDPKALLSIKRTLDRAEAGHQRISAYYSHLGLAVEPPESVGYLEDERYTFEGGGSTTLPALVTTVDGPDGAVVATYRIYLNPSGAGRADVAPSEKFGRAIYKGATKGAAIRLREPAGGEIGLAQKIEIAEAVFQATGAPCWATVTSLGMRRFVPPEGVTGVRIWSDNDASEEGQRAADELSKRLLDQGLSVAVVVPPAIDTDWLGTMQAEGEGYLQRQAELAPLKRQPAHSEAASKGKQKTAQEATAADQLMELAESQNMEFFHAQDGRPFAVAMRDGRKEVYEIGSEKFQLLLSREYYKAKRRTIPKSALETAVRHMAAGARLDNDMRKVYNRVAPHPDSGVVVDLGDESWRAVVVTPEGWEVVGDAALFVRDKAQSPLPEPQPGGDIEELRAFIPLDDGDWRLLVAWIVQAWMPKGPYPLLEITGLPGSAKTCRTRAIISLVDPHIGSLQAMPKEERDLVISALHTHVLAFDNISRISNNMSDTLCRLATGGGFRIRRLYFDAEETIIETCRPVIINGINRVCAQQDLISRAVQITVPPISANERRFEADIFAEFEEARPRIMGAFLTLLSRVLAELPRVTLESKPRLADFARLGVAVERVLSWPEGSFLRAYDSTKRSALESSLEDDPVGVAIIKLLREQESWTGTASELHEALARHLSPSMRKSRGWPKSGNWLSNRMDRLALGLEAVGIRFFKQDYVEGGARKVICLFRDGDETEMSEIASGITSGIAVGESTLGTSAPGCSLATHAKSVTTLIRKKSLLKQVRA